MPNAIALKHQILYSGFILLFLCIPCYGQTKVNSRSTTSLVSQIQKLTGQMAEAEKNDDLDGLIKFYKQDAILMPEYQLTLKGKDEIEIYFKEILKSQQIHSFQKEITEFIELGNTVVAIGTFKKKYNVNLEDTIVNQHGKYWNVWERQSNGDLKIKGESFGFFHPVINPKALIVDLNKKQPGESELILQHEIPFELKAYNALMEKGVRNRNGVLRSQFFTTDGSFMPFADSTVTGIVKIKPYLIAYSQRGNVIIDSINCYTYHFEYLDEYILEYPMFKVKWRAEGYSGRTEGKGIRIWQRQKDQSLRLYREIGTHNVLE